MALDIRRRVRGKEPMRPFVAPPRLCAISLGKWDGLVVLGRWVAVRGVLAAVCKALIEWYFVNFLPLPYWVLKRLPFKQPRRDGGTRGLPKERHTLTLALALALALPPTCLYSYPYPHPHP